MLHVASSSTSTSLIDSVPEHGARNTRIRYQQLCKDIGLFNPILLSLLPVDTIMSAVKQT